MRIALAPFAFRNGDLPFNLRQVRRGLEAARGRADLVCFGETFLQGFDALSWDFAQDRHIAVSQQSPTVTQLCRWTRELGVDLLLGYVELDGPALYSSCMLLSQGRLLHNYRRISPGWKDPTRANGHYREGASTRPFRYRGREFQLALCGDLWEAPQRFVTQGVLLWPVYVNFSPEQWAAQEPAYAAQARLASRQALLVNSLSQDPPAHGGAYFFVDGRTAARVPLDREDLLLVELDPPGPLS